MPDSSQDPWFDHIIRQSNKLTKLKQENSAGGVIADTALLQAEWEKLRAGQNFVQTIGKDFNRTSERIVKLDRTIKALHSELSRLEEIAEEKTRPLDEIPMEKMKPAERVIHDKILSTKIQIQEAIKERTLAFDRLDLWSVNAELEQIMLPPPPILEKHPVFLKRQETEAEEEPVQGNPPSILEIAQAFTKMRQAAKLDGRIFSRKNIPIVEASRLLRKNPRTIYRWIRNDELTKRRRGTVTRKSLESLCEELGIDYPR